MMRRVGTIGLPGAGKTTFSRRLSTMSGVPYEEMDGLYHGKNWTRRPSFSADVCALASREEWITEVLYEETIPVLAPRLDLLIIFDLPFFTTYKRLVHRTVARRMRRTELWNGNHQGPVLRALFDRDHILRWAFRQRDEPDRLARMVEALNPNVERVHFRKRGDSDTFLDKYFQTLEERAHHDD